MRYEEAVEIILSEEGGYVHDPTDRGGETKYGISKRAYPEEDIPKLTKARARELYRRDYWDRMRLDEFPEALRLPVFDFAVNAGTVRAARTIQKLAGVKQDGIVGPKTLEAAWKVTVSAYTKARQEYYARIVRTKPSQGKFFRGWTLRAQRIAAIVEGKEKSHPV